MNIEQVWASYKASLKAFLHSRVANPDDVDDLLQEILIKVHQHLPELRQQHSVKSWLFQVTNRTIIDFYRQRRHQEISGDDFWLLAEQETANTESTSAEDIKQELSQCIAPFIQALPADTGELLTSIDLEGTSQKRYAEQHGVSYSTLKSRVQKGRTSLKAIFDDCCHFELDQQGNLIGYEEKPNNCRRC